MNFATHTCWPALSPQNPFTAMWSNSPMRHAAPWFRLRLGFGPPMLALRASNSVSSLRKYIAGESRNVSRAQRSTSEAKWCAADTDLGFTRDRRLNARKSGMPDLRVSSRSVAVPDQRRTAPLRFGLHRSLHARIAGDALAVDLDELVGFVLDLVHEARRVVPVLQQPHAPRAKRLV